MLQLDTPCMFIWKNQSLIFLYPGYGRDKTQLNWFTRIVAAFCLIDPNNSHNKMTCWSSTVVIIYWCTGICQGNKCFLSHPSPVLPSNLIWRDWATLKFRKVESLKLKLHKQIIMQCWMWPIKKFWFFCHYLLYTLLLLLFSCPPLSPRICQIQVHCVDGTIYFIFSFHRQSFPASGSFPMTLYTCQNLKSFKYHYEFLSIRGKYKFW